MPQFQTQSTLQQNDPREYSGSPNNNIISTQSQQIVPPPMPPVPVASLGAHFAFNPALMQQMLTTHIPQPSQLANTLAAQFGHQTPLPPAPPTLPAAFFANAAQIVPPPPPPPAMLANLPPLYMLSDPMQLGAIQTPKEFDLNPQFNMEAIQVPTSNATATTTAQTAANVEQQQQQQQFQIQATQFQNQQQQQLNEIKQEKSDSSSDKGV